MRVAYQIEENFIQNFDSLFDSFRNFRILEHRAKRKLKTSRKF